VFLRTLSVAKAMFEYEYGASLEWDWRENWSTVWLPITSSTINLTWTSLQSNSDLHSERPVTGMVFLVTVNSFEN
jgi:hypothetical protein